MENINILLKQAMQDKDAVKTKVYRSIKSEFILFKTAKNAKPLDEVAMIGIINKMIKQRKESAKQYKNADREDLSKTELEEISILETLLPKAASEQEIRNVVIDKIKSNNWKSIPKKSMGLIIKEAKGVLVNVDGKLLSIIVKEYVND